MRLYLRWALSATVVSSVGAVWIGKAPVVVEALEPRLASSALPEDVSSRLPATPAASPVTGPLPAELPSAVLEPAKRDVFVPYNPPAPALPIASPIAVQVEATASPPPPATPQVPALNLRFLGSMVTPGGERLVYLARGEAVVPVTVGDRLEEGYVITALAKDAITFNFPPLNAQVVVPISEPAQP